MPDAFCRWNGVAWVFARLSTSCCLISSFDIFDARLRGGEKEGIQPRHRDQHDGRELFLGGNAPRLRLRWSLTVAAC